MKISKYTLTIAGVKTEVVVKHITNSKQEVSCDKVFGTKKEAEEFSLELGKALINRREVM